MEIDKFINRHLGVSKPDKSTMLNYLGCQSVQELIQKTIPQNIVDNRELNLHKAISEHDYLKHIKTIASKNKVYKTYIGQGYYNTITPSVILRNIFENPSWYTSYTPYQAEISQGRLEALLNFQTMVCGLTAMPIANCSLLDEATAAAEALILMYNKRDKEQIRAGINKVFVDAKIFSQTLDVLQLRAENIGIEIILGDYKEFTNSGDVFGAIVQYPNSDGIINDYRSFTERIKNSGALTAVIADLMSLAILTPPGEWGADIVCGSTQRFGIPMGFGGPHAAYFATTDELKRNIPGRIIGVSVDRTGNRALRMALQTREQHIKREKATSNICTAQALLANMAGMYGVYHGSEGIKAIALRIHSMAAAFAKGIEKLGLNVAERNFFDTVLVHLPGVESDIIVNAALAEQINILKINNNCISVSTDETTTLNDINQLLKIFAQAINKEFVEQVHINELQINDSNIRTSLYMQEEVFAKYRTETEIMRYIKKLERKDISLTHSMISLGSCTMKLNPATAMLPLSWAEFGAIHPFVPNEQANGYIKIISELEHDLAQITGFAAVSLQPNSGAAGEYAGLVIISEYHKSMGNGHRNVVLIPSSAHGTNPASAVMAGCKVVVVKCDEKGNIDITDLQQKADAHKSELHSFMVTYPSTHGVFEAGIKQMVDIIHSNGGQVYMDGANMNAQVGITSPGFIGADVCHLNLHKTFAIPHGGGGPGVGPVCVAAHLKEFLPGHSVINTGGNMAVKAVSAAPYGSAFVLPITYAYIKMLGASGLKKSTETAILNANYLAKRLSERFDILYKGENGTVGHEMIVDCRSFRQEYGISTLDIAKRLMDYGFHAPTLSFPVAETLMIEPTESESKAELDRFMEAMFAIKDEMEKVKNGEFDKDDNPLKNAPHTQLEICSDSWQHKYSRKTASLPLEWVADNKFWPGCSRVDEGYGDRNLVCNCG